MDGQKEKTNLAPNYCIFLYPIDFLLQGIQFSRQFSPFREVVPPDILYPRESLELLLYDTALESNNPRSFRQKVVSQQYYHKPLCKNNET